MKKNIILVLVLSIIWWLYFWLNYYSENSRKLNNQIDWFNFSELPFNDIKSEKLEIKNNKIIYTWTWEFITDKEIMNKFISDLKEIKIISIASTNKSNFSKFWITNSWSVLKIDNTDIILWKNKWYYWNEYIQIKWIDKVYLIDKDLKSIVNKEVNFFRKKEEKKVKSWSWEVSWS